MSKVPGVGVKIIEVNDLKYNEEENLGAYLEFWGEILN